MILDVRRLGLSLAAAEAVFFCVSYLGDIGVIPSKLTPAFYSLNIKTGFVMADLLSGSIAAAFWGYVFGALVAVVYNRVGR